MNSLGCKRIVGTALYFNSPIVRKCITHCRHILWQGETKVNPIEEPPRRKIEIEWAWTPKSIKDDTIAFKDMLEAKEKDKEEQNCLLRGSESVIDDWWRTYKMMVRLLYTYLGIPWNIHVIRTTCGYAIQNKIIVFSQIDIWQCTLRDFTICFDPVTTP